jgi:uncharacterized protein with GYD domain
MRLITLVKYAPQSVKGIIGGADREAALKGFFESAGGRLVSIVFTRGEWDAIVTAEAPDMTTATGLLMAVRATGSVTEMCALEEIDLVPSIKVAQKALAAYKPAG